MQSSAKRKPACNKIKRTENIAGILFTMPFTIGLLLFIVIPVCISLYYSFCNFNIVSPPRFIGLANYIKMFTGDPLFWKSLGVTLYFAFISVPLKLCFALFVAIILLKTTRASAFYRAAYYLPSIFGGSVAVAVLWKRMWSTDGVVNGFFALIGLPSDFAWLGNEITAMWVLVILAVWQFGSSMLIFLASLKQIPTSLYEAASIDGAGKPHQFLHITFPLLTPTIFFNLVMQTIGGFLAFTQCMIITQGKPLNSTLFYAVYMYKQSFEFHQAGYGAAMAWGMLIVIGLVSGILFSTKKFWVYDGGL